MNLIDIKYYIFVSENNFDAMNIKLNVVFIYIY